MAAAVCVVAFGVELVERHPAAYERGLVLAGVGEPDEDAPGRSLLRLRHRRVGPLRQAAHRRAHAASALVGRAAHRTALALAPLLEQGGGEQRQAARLVEYLGDQRIRERRLDAQAGTACRFLDRTAQLVASHRADEHLVGAHEAGELVVARAAAVEVGAHRQYQRSAPVAVASELDQRVDEAAALPLVAAGRERLLELVDDQDDALASVLRVHPLLAPRADARPGASPRGASARSRAARRRRALAADRPAPRRTFHCPTARPPPAAGTRRGGRPGRPPAARARRRSPRAPRRRSRARGRGRSPAAAPRRPRLHSACRARPHSGGRAGRSRDPLRPRAARCAPRRRGPRWLRSPPKPEPGPAPRPHDAGSAVLVRSPPPVPRPEAFRPAPAGVGARSAPLPPDRAGPARSGVRSDPRRPAAALVRCGARSAAAAGRSHRQLPRHDRAPRRSHLLRRRRGAMSEPCGPPRAAGRRARHRAAWPRRCSGPPSAGPAPLGPTRPPTASSRCRVGPRRTPSSRATHAPRSAGRPAQPARGRGPRAAESRPPAPRAAPWVRAAHRARGPERGSRRAAP